MAQLPCLTSFIVHSLKTKTKGNWRLWIFFPSMSHGVLKNSKPINVFFVILKKKKENNSGMRTEAWMLMNDCTNTHQPKLLITSA